MARKRIKESTQARTNTVENLKKAIEQSRAAAPDPIPIPPSADIYRAPASEVTVDFFLMQIDDAVRAGHVIAIYDALPPSYRKDVDGLVKAATKKMDAENWDSIFSSLQKIGDVIVMHQNWLLSSPRIQRMSSADQTTLRRKLIPIAGGLRIALAPKDVSFDSFQSTPFRAWLEKLDKKLAPYLAESFSNSSASRPLILVDSSTEDSATVTLESGGIEHKIQYVKIEGCWVPKSVADSWTQSIEDLKKQFTEYPNGTYLVSTRTMLESLVDATTPMTEAKTVEEFHDAFEFVAAPLDTFLAVVGPVLFPPAPKPVSEMGEEEAHQHQMEQEARMQAERDARMQAEQEAAANAQ